jgi:hypothetical protein
MTTFSLIAKQDYLEKVARTRDPIRAVSEFVWNSLDADATRVSVEFGLNVRDGIQENIIREDETSRIRIRTGASSWSSS